MNLKYYFRLLWLIMLIVSSSTYAVSTAQFKERKNMKIRITGVDAVLTATMYDIATSRDFISLMPLTLDMSDYASTEKVSDLPKKLTTLGAPAGCEGNIGDITLYAPWGNLAIFYKKFGYAKGLVSMGKIDAGQDEIKKLSGKVLFELID